MKHVSPLLQCYGVSHQLCLYHIQQVIMQMFDILCCKLCCATFTISKAVPPSYDCITYITWHHTKYPSMQGYDLQLASPAVPFFEGYPFHLFMELGRTKVQLHHIQYITQYIHIQKGVEFSIVPFLQGHGVYVYPIYKDIWTWSVPLIMIVYRIYAYMVSFLGQQTSLQPFYSTR